MSESSPIATNSNNSPSAPDDISYQQDIDSKFADIDSKFEQVDGKLENLTHMISALSEFIRTSSAGQGSGGAMDKTPAVEQTPVRDSASFVDFDSQISTEQAKPSGQTLLQDMELESLRRGLTSLRRPPTTSGGGAVLPVVPPPVVPSFALPVVPPPVVPTVVQTVLPPVPGNLINNQINTVMRNSKTFNDTLKVGFTIHDLMKLDDMKLLYERANHQSRLVVTW
jgi:hypothetical protein